jgi:two-component system sensor histidine kinase BaeS
MIKLATSIRSRLTLSYLAVIVVAMGFSGFLLLSLLEQYFLKAMEDSLVAQARITAQTLIPGARAEDPSADVPSSAFNTVQQRTSNIALQAQNVAPPADEPLANIDLSYLTSASLQLSSQLDTRIRILDAQGVVLVDSYQQDQGTSLQDDPLVAQALAGQYARRADSKSYRDASGTWQHPAMYLAMPLVADGRLVGAVYLSQPLTDALAVVADLRLRWLASTLVALLLSAIVGLVLSGAIARPLRHLTRAAGAVAQGQFDQQVPVQSRDELGRLSQAFNDMTARLQAARRAQTDFVANVSHELRTPLTAVKGLIETLRDGAVDDPEVRDRFLETVENETDRLIRLVNDLLILSRADSEALSLRRQPVDLARLVRVAIDRMSAKAQSRQLVLLLETTNTTPSALFDPDRIEQVLVNLLDNAIKYSRPGSKVIVRVEGGPGDMAQIQVQDQGIGIPAEDLARIGERFYRADKARSRAEGGSGLGIAIARTLVEAHGGRLWLDSVEGQGTTVTFQLPQNHR